MTPKTTAAIIVVVVLLIALLVYIFFGEHIRKILPKPGVHRYLGGTTATEREIIIIDLRDIHNADIGVRHNQLTQYLRNIRPSNRRDVIYAIVDMAEDPNIEYNYIFDVLDTSEALGIIDSQSDIIRELRTAITNPENGRIVIPESVISRINRMNDIGIRLRRS